jgi:hypothetical protein
MSVTEPAFPIIVIRMWPAMDAAEAVKSSKEKLLL